MELERTVSFRYPSRKSAAFDDYLAHWLASKQFTITLEMQRVFHGFSKQDLKRAERLLFTPKQAREMRVHGQIPLSEEKLAALARHVTIYVSRGTRPDGITVQLETAGRNIMPGLSVELWLLKRLRLPGGFVTIRSPRDSDLAISELVGELREMLRGSR
jgi:hypothetical protein